MVVNKSGGKKHDQKSKSGKQGLSFQIKHLSQIISFRRIGGGGIQHQQPKKGNGKDHYHQGNIIKSF